MAKARQREDKEKKPTGPCVESPTWEQLKETAKTVLDLLDKNGGAANLLSYPKFYTLAILAALHLDEDEANAPIFGRRWLT